MAEIKKRATIRLGFVFGTREIDADTDAVLVDRVVNVWGCSYDRLEHEEAILFEKELQVKCGKQMLDLMETAMEVAADFGLETVLGIPAGTDPKTFDINTKSIKKS
jgi:hypothetical protein